MKITKNHKPLTLNIAFSYTAREEMAQAIRVISEAVKHGILNEDDITENLLEQCLYTRMSPQPELLIRTSGEVRLSDFMLWQSTYSVTFFTKVLWPDFMIWNLIQGIFYFQLNYIRVEESQKEIQAMSERLTKLDKPNRIAKFLYEIESKRNKSFIS